MERDLGYKSSPIQYDNRKSIGEKSLDFKTDILYSYVMNNYINYDTEGLISSLKQISENILNNPDEKYDEIFIKELFPVLIEIANEVKDIDIQAQNLRAISNLITLINDESFLSNKKIVFDIAYQFISDSPQPIMIESLWIIFNTIDMFHNNSSIPEGLFDILLQICNKNPEINTLTTRIMYRIAQNLDFSQIIIQMIEICSKCLEILSIEGAMYICLVCKIFLDYDCNLINLFQEYHIINYLILIYKKVDFRKINDYNIIHFLVLLQKIVQISTVLSVKNYVLAFEIENICELIISKDDKICKNALDLILTVVDKDQSFGISLLKQFSLISALLNKSGISYSMKQCILSFCFSLMELEPEQFYTELNSSRFFEDYLVFLESDKENEIFMFLSTILNVLYISERLDEKEILIDVFFELGILGKLESLSQASNNDEIINVIDQIARLLR